ncbi:MAG: DUF3592 domain-containing protein [Xanthobacteraceae bacterium]|nr:DUF3592 domain-containing protein [Xanthobacteraceae bacterium]
MSDIWFLYLVLAAFPALLLFAIVYKYVEVAQAARWPSTQGRVVVSKAQAREVDAGGPSSSDTETRNFAKIVYEYSLGGRVYRGDRVSIGEDTGNFQVAETLARYPVGTVVTVYYNPRKRAQAVLEREAPPGMWRTATIVALVLVGVIVAAVVGFRKLGELVAALVPNPAQAPFVTACIGFALLATFVISGIGRHASAMRRWPTVPGRIESVDVRAFQTTSTSGGRKRRVTRYRPNVVYSYEVAGLRYTGDEVGILGRFSSNIPALVQPRGRAPGDAVKIHYNPENPAESILDPRPGVHRMLWLIPATVLAIAWLAAR